MEENENQGNNLPDVTPEINDFCSIPLDRVKLLILKFRNQLEHIRLQPNSSPEGIVE